MGKKVHRKLKAYEKLAREKRVGLMFDLVNAFKIVKKPIETALFLQDLLTANEIRNLSIRLRIAKLLLAGGKYRDIQDELHVSFATITKVSTWFEQGGEGFKHVIAKLPLKWDLPKDLPRGPIEFHLPQTLIALAQYKAAKSQDKQMEKFIKAIEGKKALDREMKKVFDEYYSELALEKKSVKKRAEFRQKIKKAN
jgi:TrpR-related protein YerC/YecD